MKPKKVLLVDEEKWYIDGVIDRINNELGENRYDYAMDGNEALDFISKNDYALIVLDMMLPIGKGNILVLETNSENPVIGLEVLKELRKTHPNLPIVCYTALKDDSVKQEILKENALYISKLSETSFDELCDLIKINLENNE